MPVVIPGILGFTTNQSNFKNPKREITSKTMIIQTYC